MQDLVSGRGRVRVPATYATRLVAPPVISHLLTVGFNLGLADSPPRAPGITSSITTQSPTRPYHLNTLPISGGAMVQPPGARAVNFATDRDWLASSIPPHQPSDDIYNGGIGIVGSFS